MSATALFRPNFTDLRAEIERRVAQEAPTDDIAALIDQFLASGGDRPAPLVEYDGTITWLYRDAAATEVSVIGDILGNNPAQTRMTKLAGTDLFYLTAQMPLDTQIAYVFAVDNPQPSDDLADREAWLARCRPDPLNQHQIIATHPLRQLSVLTMASAAPVNEIEDIGNDAPLAVDIHVLSSVHTGALHRIWVYTPPEYHPESQRYPVCYFLDGEAYLLSARVPLILDALLAQYEISPSIAVFVETRDGSVVDAPYAAQIAQLLVHDIVPWVDAHYATSTDPHDRILGGALRNAAVALHTALATPDVFGGVIAQSPSADLLTTETARQIGALLGAGGELPRCYMDVGRYESIDIQKYAHTLCNALLTGGSVLSYQEFAGDSGFLGWRSTMPDALRVHFGASTISDL